MNPLAIVKKIPLGRLMTDLLSTIVFSLVVGQPNYFVKFGDLRGS